jgi:hypothetical protein
MEGEVAELREKWGEQGYMVIPGFAPASSIEELKQHMQELITTYEGTKEFAIFSTKEQAV